MSPKYSHKFTTFLQHSVKYIFSNSWIHGPIKLIKSVYLVFFQWRTGNFERPRWPQLYGWETMLKYDEVELIVNIEEYKYTIIGTDC